MNYTEILRLLEKASLFDVYRLSAAMSSLLHDQRKIIAIKQYLHVGMSISYFSCQSNKLEEGVIDEIRQNTVYAHDKSNGKKWSIPLCAINLDNVNTDLYPRSDQKNLDRNQFQVGEGISFLGKNNIETYGIITQLNPKTASIAARDGTNWRVHYCHLFKVWDASKPKDDLGVIIDMPPGN